MIAPGFQSHKVSPGVFIYIFNPWGRQQRSVLAIKGKTPGSKPRDLSIRWAFSASYVLKGYECQSPGNSSELPGYPDASPLPKKLSTVHWLRTWFSFRPPSTTLFRSRPTMGSRLLRADKKLSHRQGTSVFPCESTRAKSRGGYLRGISTDQYLHLPRVCPQPRSTKRNTHQLLHGTPACTCRSKVLRGVQGLNQGRVEGGLGNATKCTRLSDISRSRRLLVACARHCSHWQLPGSTKEGENRKREEERRGEERNQRMRGCAGEGMWTNGHPFICLSGLSVVAVTVSTKQPLECRRLEDKFKLEFVFRKQ